MVSFFVGYTLICKRLHTLFARLTISRIHLSQIIRIMRFCFVKAKPIRYFMNMLI